MTKQVQRRRGTASQHTSFTGADGELSVNTTNKSVHVHDGINAGGIEAARADLNNVTGSSILSAIGVTSTATELNYTSGVTSSIQTQLDTKAPINNPTFTGTTIVPTADINGGTIDGTTIGSASPAAISGTAITGTSFVSSGDMSFADNAKAVFGAGSDLQIYHDGGNSFISDVGTGDFIIRAGNLRMQNSTGTAQYILADDGGAVQLRYNGTTKIATTATGINVTGTVTADGLVVTGTVDGRDVSVDGTKLDGIEAGADVTDTANVTAAGAVMQTTSVGSATIPAGITTQRDAIPVAGYFRFNTDLSKFEGYNGASWGSVGGGATGGGSDAIFIENGQTVTTNYTIAADKNAMTTGPITINSGVVVTVSTGARWVVI